MTGWRSGAVVGNADLVDAYWQLKTNVDSGMFEALQEASAAALRSDQSSVREMCAIYQRRRDVLVSALRRHRPEVRPPRGAIYVWARVPEGETSAAFTERVLEEAAVVISPGAAYGPSGEGFVRMSLTVPDERLNEAAERIAGLMGLSRGAALPRPAPAPGGRPPERAHPGDAGLDLFAVEGRVIPPGGRAAGADGPRRRPPRRPRRPGGAALGPRPPRRRHGGQRAGPDRRRLPGGAIVVLVNLGAEPHRSSRATGWPSSS